MLGKVSRQLNPMTLRKKQTMSVRPCQSHRTELKVTNKLIYISITVYKRKVNTLEIVYKLIMFM